MLKRIKTIIFVISFIICGFTILSCERKQPAGGGIIALTPSLTEAVWAVGTSEHIPLVATSPFTTDKRADGLVRLQAEGSLEQIVAMKPSLVLLHPSDSLLATKLEALGIPILARGMDTIADVEATLFELGTKLGREQAAQQAVEKMRREMVYPIQKSDVQKPVILLIIDRLDMRMQQFYTAQSPAFIADLVEGCGYHVMHVKTEAWARLDAETLIQMNPEQILFLARGTSDAAQVKSEFVRVFQSSLDAVKTGRLYVYDDPDITVPGPEMGRRQQKLCNWLGK